MIKQLIALLLAGALAGVPALDAPALPETGSELGLAASGIAQVEDTLYVADSYQRAIWKIDGDQAELLTGSNENLDQNGRPLTGYLDGDMEKALFGEPWAVIPYLDGLLVSDAGNHVLRYVDLEDGKVYSAAGSGEAGFQDGSVNRRIAFNMPTGLALGEDDLVYIADTGNHAIRVMDKKGNVSTLAGGEEGCALGTLEEARFSQPTGLCYANEVLYVADSGNHRIVAIEDGQVRLVAGASLSEDLAEAGDLLNGSVEQATFSNPQGIAVAEDGTVYVADTGNGAVRRIQDGRVTTVLQAQGDDVYPVSPRGLWIDGDTLYVGDVFMRVLAQYDLGA